MKINDYNDQQIACKPIFDMYRLDAGSVVKTFLASESQVTHLERDKFVLDNIIFSDYAVGENWEV